MRKVRKLANGKKNIQQHESIAANNQRDCTKNLKLNLLSKTHTHFHLP